ncbi:hypothetical protein [Deinococcus multiflagellatus]|uniref:Uncharacterized protein n=1 Tax=Deinococcus multiflagellatus TaxID=1656887 RepID=A0ABW1ZFB1_9DEIO
MKTASPVPPGDGRTLRVFIWSEYMDPDIVKAFEEQTGARVILDTFESNEAMLAKLQGAGPPTTSWCPVRTWCRRWCAPGSFSRWTARGCPT